MGLLQVIESVLLQPPFVYAIKTFPEVKSSTQYNKEPAACVCPAIAPAQHLKYLKKH